MSARGGKGRRRGALLGAVLMLGLAPQIALAADWSRSLTREGPAGGSITRSGSCEGSRWSATCARTLDVETRSGETYSADRTTEVTRVRPRGVTRIETGDETILVAPRRWRRW